LAGSVGQETINGGLDNDTIEGRGGSDLIDGGAGNDVLKWQFTGGGQIDRTLFMGGSDTDTLQLENIANSTIWSFEFRTLDDVTPLIVGGNGGKGLKGIENVQLVGGATGSEGDQFLIRDSELVKSYDITLRNPAKDVISMNGISNGASHIVGTSSIADGLSITGLSASLRVHNVAAKDVIQLEASTSDDVIDMSGLRFVPFGLTIKGGFGNDTIIGSKGTALSSVKPELFGDNGDDTIVGGTGGEVIYGGHGSDTLFSSGLGTTFRFRGGDLGTDTIYNFGVHSQSQPADRLDLRETFLSHLTFNEAKSLGYISDVGNDVLISDPNYVYTVLVGVHVSQLSSADFLI
jgi:Ca2+-binding RTX toxin-like protein